MILVCGIPSETPVELLVEELDITGANYLLWNPRKFNETSIHFSLSEEGKITGVLKYENTPYKLEDISAIYTRLTDWNTLPEIEAVPYDKALRKQCENVHFLLQYFIDNCSALVVNPSDAMMSNNSKPYQMHLARQVGIKIPDTLITTNSATAKDFYYEHDEQIIYKSISGTRSIVQRLKEADMNRLQKLFYCPTQFQQFIGGENVRVHVINETTFATAIKSEATDYRYAGSQVGEDAVLQHIELKASNNRKCIYLSKYLGLFFSGIDFKKNAAEDLCCFEANPMPGYSYYEQSASQPIAYTLACELKKKDEAATSALSFRKK